MATSVTLTITLVVTSSIGSPTRLDERWVKELVKKWSLSSELNAKKRSVKKKTGELSAKWLFIEQADQRLM